MQVAHLAQKIVCVFCLCPQKNTEKQHTIPGNLRLLAETLAKGRNYNKRAEIIVDI
jgi:hypothetical protein